MNILETLAQEFNLKTEQVEKTVAIDPAQFGGEAPADDFYYGAE